jgi:hypothetical protein
MLHSREQEKYLHVFRLKDLGPNSTAMSQGCCIFLSCLRFHVDLPITTSGTYQQVNSLRLGNIFKISHLSKYLSGYLIYK